MLSITSDNHWLDLRGTEFGDLIGFDKKIVKKTEYGAKLPNITSSIDQININTSAIKDIIVDGRNTDTIAVVPTPFTFEPRRLKFCPASSHEISNMRIYLTDSKGRPVDLNNIDRAMVLILRSTGKGNYIV